MGRANAPVRPIVTHSEGRHTKAAPKGTADQAGRERRQVRDAEEGGAEGRQGFQEREEELRLDTALVELAVTFLCACLCDGVLGAESRLAALR
eukprot:scaffold58239_cov62-Phaeocystis_antarctica.AAC.6